MNYAPPITLKRDYDPITMLYIVTTPEGTPCKIGVSRNPKVRMDSIQCNNWIELYLHKIFSYKNALALEQAVLKRYENKIIRGEWIDIDAFELEAGVREVYMSINAPSQNETI